MGPHNAWCFALAALLVACDGSGSSTVPDDLPACSVSAVTGAACFGDQVCEGCSAGAVYTCGCVDAGPLDDADGGASRWLCVGAEQECP